MKITVKQLKALIREAISGRLQTSGPFAGTTAEIVETIEAYLRSRGHTGIRSNERWARDGVMLIVTDQSKQPSRKSGRRGWQLAVSGDDSQYGAGVTFGIDLDSDRTDQFEVSTWEELIKLIDTRWW